MDKPAALPQPDNNYLQAMLKQKVNMNQGSQSSATLKRGLLPATDIDPNQFEHLLEGTLSPKSSSNQSASNESGTKKRENILNNSISSYSLRAMKRNAEANMQKELSDKKLSQSMAVLPNDPEAGLAGKQPKSLVNKLSHLMKDTKSSAMRNAGNATSKSNYASGSYNTIEGESPMKSRSPYKSRGSPAKSLKPKMGHSKSKGALKGTPSKELNDNLAGAFLLDSSLNFNFEGDVEMGNEPLGPPKEGEMTLEGIDGIVLMSSENSHPSSEPSPIEPTDQHSGGAEREFEDQLEEESKDLKLQGMSLSETLDQQAISIDQKGLDDLSKKASFEEMQLSSRSWSKQKERPKVEFDSEIMSIIGSINSKAKQIKDKFNIGGKEQEKTTPRAHKTIEQGDSTAGRRSKWAEADPLQEIALELSKEVSESENEGSKTPTLN